MSDSTLLNTAHRRRSKRPRKSEAPQHASLPLMLKLSAYFGITLDEAAKLYYTPVGAEEPEYPEMPPIPFRKIA